LTTFIRCVALEVVGVAEVDLTPELLGLDELFRSHGAEGGEGLFDQLDLAIGPLLALFDLLFHFLAAGIDLLGLGTALFHTLELVLEGLETNLVPLLELVLDDLDLVAHGSLELRQVLLPALVIDRRDDVAGEVDDLLQLLRGHVEQVAEPAWDTLEEPDVGDGGGELDVAHPLATHLGSSDLDPTALADDPLVADPLVLPAVALPVPLGTEDALVEEPLLLRAEGSVIDRLRLLHLSV
jgi:hypothetical protein